MCSFSNKWASKWGNKHTHTPFAELHQLAKSLVFHSQIGYQFKPKLYVKVLYMDAKSFPCGRLTNNSSKLFIRSPCLWFLVSPSNGLFPSSCCDCSYPQYMTWSQPNRKPLEWICCMDRHFSLESCSLSTHMFVMSVTNIYLFRLQRTF